MDTSDVDMTYHVMPEWSRALALIAQSPVWDGQQQAKDAFMDAAERYSGYPQLPPHLKVIYRNAERALPHPQRHS